MNQFKVVVTITTPVNDDGDTSVDTKTYRRVLGLFWWRIDRFPGSKTTCQPPSFAWSIARSDAAGDIEHATGEKPFDSVLWHEEAEVSA